MSRTNMKSGPLNAKLPKCDGATSGNRKSAKDQYKLYGLTAVESQYMPAVALYWQIITKDTNAIYQ
jgi:hypothetical protein